MAVEIGSFRILATWRKFERVEDKFNFEMARSGRTDDYGSSRQVHVRYMEKLGTQASANYSITRVHQVSYQHENEDQRKLSLQAPEEK